MRILITGSRTWTDIGLIQRTLLGWLAENTPDSIPVLVSGACPNGADRIAEWIWEKEGYPVERHPAKWDEYGKRAGMIRNNKMVKMGADICFAFIENASSGSSNAASLAEKAGIPTIRIEKNYIANQN